MNALTVIQSSAHSSVPQEAELVHLDPDLLCEMHAHWRAANYISIGQAYLKANLLLEAPLVMENVKPGMLCHGSNTVALNFLYVHLDRLIKENDLSMILVTGDSECAAVMAAQESNTERFSSIRRNRDGLKPLAVQHVLPRSAYGLVPISAQEIVRDDDAGNSLLHAYGAAFESPELIVACFIENDQVEIGTLAAGWHYNKFLDPMLDGAVLPILHLGGVIGHGQSAHNPHSDDEIIATLRTEGYEPSVIECNDPEHMHEALDEGLDAVLASIADIQSSARSAGSAQQIERPRWPVLIFHTPGDWIGPAFVEGSSNVSEKGTCRVPDTHLTSPNQVSQLQAWMKSYASKESFDESGNFREKLASLATKYQQSSGSNSLVDNDSLSSQSSLPGLHRYAVMVREADDVMVEGRRVLATCLGDIEALGRDVSKQCCFFTQETLESRLVAITVAFGSSEGRRRICEATPRPLAHALSQHILDEWLTSYQTTGRLELFSCYDAFIQAVDVLLQQHMLLKQHMYRWACAESTPLHELTFVPEREPERISLQPLGKATDGRVSALELFHSPLSEQWGCYVTKPREKETVPCSCGRLNNETDSASEPVVRQRQTIGEFKEEEFTDKRGIPHWHWTY